ncbi:MAG: hypothetical protein NW241_16375, partial [Bacteroidia bacterium]|nr:hypothetical protein [Bacteroidia bacterium]
MSILKRALSFSAAAFASVALFAQATDSDDINISATFTSAIDLNVTAGDNIAFTVATLEEYSNGVADPAGIAYSSTFEVSASTDFEVELSATDFLSAAGDTLDAANFGYTIEDMGTYQAGVNHLLLGAAASPSAIAVLGTDEMIVEAAGAGNAGPFSANTYKLNFELGTAAARAVSGL